MASGPLFPLDAIDLSRTVAGLEEIRKANPQRFEMEQLTRIVHYDRATNDVAGVLELPAVPWWARGHVPGRPLMPGVLMLEAAAQLCSFGIRQVLTAPEYAARFFGFGGIDGVKFRGTIVPGDTLLILGHPQDIRPRRAVYETQGWVGDRLCFEASITGLWV
ncbi:MAG: beta-hydroxyacyl-ACP dehydratase [Planctomycetes bacterium]|nr:beta-hydroxyacyl-ACP dehydratase [Planctomycetota bacterium]